MHAGSIDTLRRPWPLPPEPQPGVGRRHAWPAILFGIVAPLVCLVLDPCVFRCSGLLPLTGAGLYGAHAVAVYTLVLIAFGALTTWLVKPCWAAWLAGPLMVGGLTALGIAIVIFPLAVVGIFYFGVGLLGLLPFATASVYLLAGWHALRLVPRKQRRNAWALTILLGGITLALPVLAQHVVDP